MCVRNGRECWRTWEYIMVYVISKRISLSLRAIFCNVKRMRKITIWKCNIISISYATSWTATRSCDWRKGIIKFEPHVDALNEVHDAHTHLQFWKCSHYSWRPLLVSAVIDVDIVACKPNQTRKNGNNQQSLLNFGQRIISFIFTISS